MYFFKSVLALGLVALGASSPVANSTLDGRIVRGDYVEAYGAPFFCGLFRVNKYGAGDYVGGSTLIGEQTLLTSAEILEPGENYYAQCGSNSLLTGPFQEIPIETFRRHPGFGETPGDTIANNIALAYMKDPIQCGDRVQFIELQTDRFSDTANDFRVYGFGMDDFPTGNPEDVKPSYALKYVDSQRYDLEACRTYFRRFLERKEIPAGTFCATVKDPKATQCQLDQGGPIVNTATDRQFGVVSYVSPFCAVERPGVYTSVRYFLPWIIENMKPSNLQTQMDKKKNPWN